MALHYGMADSRFIRAVLNCLAFFSIGLGAGTGSLWPLLVAVVLCVANLGWGWLLWRKANAVQGARRQAFRDLYGSEPW